MNTFLFTSWDTKTTFIKPIWYKKEQAEMKLNHPDSNKNYFCRSIILTALKAFIPLVTWNNPHSEKCHINKKQLGLIKQRDYSYFEAV